MAETKSFDQVRFLLSCISHSTNGKPDFAAVAEELGIVSKAAAQKRYERMLKANNENSPKPASKASDGDDNSAVTTPKKRKTAAPAPGSAQKRRGRPPKNKTNGDDEKPVKAEEEKKDLEDDAEDSPLSDVPSTPSV